MDTRTELRFKLEALNPSLYIRLQDEGKLESYLDDAISASNDGPYNIEEGLPTDLQYDYLAELIEEEFPEEYIKFLSAGILTYELINLSEECNAVFKQFAFPDNADSRMLRYAIIGTVAEYLKGGVEDGI